MTLTEVKEVLLWCVIFNYAILLTWVGIFIFGHEWFYRIHTRWFKLSPETFDAIHLAGIAFYKLGIILLNLVPLVALHLST